MQPSEGELGAVETLNGDHRPRRRQEFLFHWALVREALRRGARLPRPCYALGPLTRRPASEGAPGRRAL